MTVLQTLWASLLRAGRVAIAQAIGALIESSAGVTIPYFGITLGVVLNGIAKFLRDKLKWEWLPI